MQNSAIMRVERTASNDAPIPQRYPEGANVMARRNPITLVCRWCKKPFPTTRRKKFCGEDCLAAARKGQGCSLYKHGAVGTHSPTPEYRAWLAMNQRCYYEPGKSYKDYGGRGIRVFEEWRGEGGFERWLAYVGQKPSPEHSFDRYPNNDGDYEPGNVRWATRKEQNNNRRPRTKGYHHTNPRTHCRSGHDYTPENPAPCRICQRARIERACAKKREQTRAKNQQQ